MINEFREKDKIEEHLLVMQVSQGVTSAGAPYLSIVLQDKSGTIDGKLWDVKPEQVKVIEAGKIMLVSGEVLKYRNALQLRIHDAIPVNEAIDINEFVESTDVPIEKLQKIIYGAIDTIEDEIYQGIVKQIFSEYDQEFFEFPAASRNHHDFHGGLATHVASMLTYAQFIIQHNPWLNSDLLIAGILLHDFGKIYELSGPVLTEYTLKGRLIGHISIMNSMIYEIAKRNGWENYEQTVLLTHLILAHHGEYEFGSPILPMVAEAEILNLIDNLDARLNMLEKMLESTDPQTFSPRIFSLENRSFYRSK